MVAKRPRSWSVACCKSLSNIKAFLLSDRIFEFWKICDWLINADVTFERYRAMLSVDLKTTHDKTSEKSQKSLIIKMYLMNKINSMFVCFFKYAFY